MIVDFHSHTYKSDGTLSPLALRDLMIARGVEWYSVSDHDTMAAYPELLAAPATPRLIVGIELNTAYHGNEVHILGYGMPSSGSSLDAEIELNRRAREIRVREMCERLCAAGIPVTFDDVRREATDANAVGRPHIAKALLSAGHVENVDDAFALFLGHGRPGHVPSSHLTPQRAIRSILEAGGIPVLAHPGRIKDQSVVPVMIEAGVQGLEVFYQSHSAEQVRSYRELAQAHDLLMTAGADFHDPGWTSWGVGREVDEADIAPFLERVSTIR